MLESVTMPSPHGTDRWNAPWREEAVVRPRARMDEDDEVQARPRTSLVPSQPSRPAMIGDKVLPWAPKVSLLIIVQRPSSFMNVLLLRGCHQHGCPTTSTCGPSHVPA